MKELTSAVSSGIDWWLREEVKESHQGRNRFLDDFDGMRASYLTGSEGYDMDVAKATGHYDRFRVLAESVRPTDSPDENDKYKIGKVIHHALMFVSGGFRMQAFLQARSQTEYEHNRYDRVDEFNGATSVDLPQAVGRLLLESDGITAFNDLKEYNLQHSDDIYKRRLEMYAWFSRNPERAEDALASQDLPIEIALETQQHGLAIAVGQIAFFGRRLGGVEAVPFLEPKSISDVADTPIYPIVA
jgi:hypothetical protein